MTIVPTPLTLPKLKAGAGANRVERYLRGAALANQLQRRLLYPSKAWAPGAGSRAVPRDCFFDRVIALVMVPSVRSRRSEPKIRATTHMNSSSNQPKSSPHSPCCTSEVGDGLTLAIVS